MPGVFQLSMDNLGAEVDEVLSLGIERSFYLGFHAEKDEVGRVHSMIMVLFKRQRDSLKNTIRSFLS